MRYDRFRTFRRLDMTWEYRVIRTTHIVDPPDIEDTYTFNIHEVYYNDDKELSTCSWTEQPMRPYGETVEELEDDLKYMLRALTKKVLVIVDDKLEEVD